jgi:hypothetical protein
MAIRRPSIASPEWLFQDFLYQAPELLGGPELRYVQVKWDGEPYTRVSQSFDYSNPPYVGSEQRGGDIVAQIDYTVQDKIITINDWSVNFRDEWPLRLASNYLIQCLYPAQRNYVIRVAGNEVYNQAGEPIEQPNRDPYAFWVSEQFFPLTNSPNDYLAR